MKMTNTAVHEAGVAHVGKLLAAHAIPAERVQGGFKTPRGRIRVLAATGDKKSLAWKFDLRKLGDVDLIALVEISHGKPRAFVAVAASAFRAHVERTQGEYLARPTTETEAPDFVVIREGEIPKEWPLLLTWLKAKD